MPEEHEMAGIVKIARSPNEVNGQPQYNLMLIDQQGAQQVPLGSIDDVRTFMSYLQQNELPQYYGELRQTVNASDASDALKQAALGEISENETKVIDALKMSNQFDIGTTTL